MNSVTDLYNSMDDNSHRRRLETSPLTVGFIGVMGGVMLVAICHIIAMLFCSRNSNIRQQTDENDDNAPRLNTSTSVGGQEQGAANDDANPSNTIQVIVDNPTKYSYDSCKESDTCAVCLGEFKDGQNQLVRVLPICGHVFHVHCIDLWLFNHHNCPLCRANALLPSHSSCSSRGTFRTNETLVSSS